MTNRTDSVTDSERIDRHGRDLVEGDAGEARAFDGLLEASGLLSLKSDSAVAAQEAALQAIASAAADLTPLRRALLRDQAVHALKRNGFESPARLVDIALTRNDNADSDAAGSDPLVCAPQPWPQAVDGARLLADVEAAILAHAVLPDGAAVAMALWILHTHCLDAAAITPRLAIISPTKRCGKTTVLKLLGTLACKPLAAASPDACGALPGRRGVLADDPRRRG